MLATRPNKMITRAKLAGIGEMEQAYDGKIAWSIDPITGPSMVSGKGLAERADEAWFDAPLHAAPLEALFLSAKKRFARLDFTPGEQHKNLASIQQGLEAALAAGLDRKSRLVGLGGGVTTDMTGFIAASYLRGVSWIGLPTTLLAMVDASVGGKTGVDLGAAKNAVGAFWQPAAVLCDVDYLKTEPTRGYRSALSEVVKTALIGDPELFELPSQRLASFGMVADGVGGHQGGETASRVAIESIAEYVKETMNAFYVADENDPSAFFAALEDAAAACHRTVIERAEASGQPTAATTLTLFVAVWPALYIMHVGDSRLYLFRRGELTQLTRDQTMAQDLVDTGVLTSDAARRTPLANVLSSALGSDTTAPVVTRLDADWGNVHLLCSDGLTKHVGDARIAEVLGGMTSARQACEQLLRDALDAGGSDNITIIVGRALPPAAPD